MNSNCWPKSAFILASILCVSSFTVVRSGAADAELFGILEQAIQPATAKELELSAQQVESIRKLISEREAEALNIAGKMRQLPPAERDSQMRASVRELEQKAYRELSIQQRGRLERMRLSKLGLASLSEKEVAETLGLSQGQTEQVIEILENRDKLAVEIGSDKARIETERRLRALVTSSQWATWQSMAGQAAKASAPVPEVAAAQASKTIEKPAVAVITPSKESSLPKPPPKVAIDQRVAPATGESNLTLNFNAAPWEQVLQWMAKEAELSLQYDTYPIGTFTYRDPYRTYTVGEAIDIMNGVLLNKAYRLIRRQRSLMVVDLGNGESADVIRGLLRELAELVSPEELDKRGELELLKCLFVLSRLSPEEAQKEIALLIGPEGSTVPLGSAGQILVTETAGKLRLIREMLKRVEDPDSTRGSKVVTIGLKHVSAEEILGIARPLLGLADGTNQSADFNVSTDTFGNTIFATGSMDKLQLLKDLALQIDVKPGEGGAASVNIEHPSLQSHPIRSSDPTTAFNVLQTLLEGSANARLSLEPKTNSIIALASEADHKLITDTLAKLAGESSSFTVIPLKRIDVQAAITTLEKFFGKPSTTTGGSAGAASAPTGPIFFGDALTRTLMVKGSPQELIQVRELLSKLEETSPEMDVFGGTVRVLPMTGKSADRVLEQIQYLWDAQKRKNRIRIKLPAESEKSEVGGQELRGRVDPPSRSRTSTEQKSSRFSSMTNGKLVSTINGQSDTETSNRSSSPSDPSDIVIFRGPTGLVVTCDDPKALAEFEQLVRLVTEQLLNVSGEPTVFYLKYITAKSADELIRSILSGEASGGGSSGGGGGGLLGSMLGEVGGGLVGGLLGLGGSGGGSSATSSTVTGGMATGEIKMTADPRLNCLMVTANAADLDLIEQLLKIIDREDSPIRIETQGRPQMIQIVYNDVEEIATIVKQVFADRISQTASAGGGGGGGGGNNQPRQPSPQEFIEALRGAGGGGGPGGGRGGGSGGRSGGQSELKPQTMTIGTDKKNNVLIVTASQSLFEQVQALVALLDVGGSDSAENIQVVQLSGNMSPEVVQSALQSVLGGKAKTNSATTSNASASTNSSGSTGGSSGSSDAEAAQRRAELFQALQSRGGFGGAPGGGFRGGVPGGGGAPGGGTRGGAPGGGGAPTSGGAPRTGR